MSFLAIVLILYIFSDVNYFIRLLFTTFICRIFQRKHKITDTTTMYGLCTSQDSDILLNHMNNARFLRELDFARLHFYIVTHLYEDLKQLHKNVTMVQGATNIRYRRPVTIFHPFKIQTKLIWWDEKAIYLEHQFITVADGFIRAVACSKQNIINCNVIDAFQNLPEAPVRPVIPDDLQVWLNSMEISSQKLRKSNKEKIS